MTKPVYLTMLDNGMQIVYEYGFTYYKNPALLYVKRNSNEDSVGYQLTSFPGHLDNMTVSKEKEVYTYIVDGELKSLYLEFVDKMENKN